MESLADILECPVCLEVMASSITQCRTGHSMCEVCANMVHQCPVCKAPITSARNFQLETVIANLRGIKHDQPSACRYKPRGCKEQPQNLADLRDHELECKKRDYACEGRRFANWQCEWSGSYENIFQHFKHCHGQNPWRRCGNFFQVKINFDHESFGIQIFPYKNGELFWYKHKVDPARKKAYWLVQHIGSKREASKFCYEFSIQFGPIQLPSIRKMCTSGSINAQDLFDNEDCAAIPFSTLRDCLNENHEVTFWFGIADVLMHTNLAALNQIFKQTQFNQPGQANPLQGQAASIPRVAISTPFGNGFAPFTGMQMSLQNNYGRHLFEMVEPDVIPQSGFPNFHDHGAMDWNQQQ